MSDVLDHFLSAARDRNWKEAYDYCNGLNMYEMLRGLDALGSPLLGEMRAQMPIYWVWGGPNMPRIEFAMDVVEKNQVPPPPDGLPDDQVQDARRFVAGRRSSTSTKKKLKITLCWTEKARNETMSSSLVRRAQELLRMNGDRLALDVQPFERIVVPFPGEVLIDEEAWQVFEMAEQAIHFGPNRLPVIFFEATAAECRPGSQCAKTPFGLTPATKTGRRFVMINTAIHPAPDHGTLLHEMGHAAGIEPSDMAETDMDNIMSYGTNRTKIRESQLERYARSYFG